MFGRGNLMRDGAKALGRVTESGAVEAFATRGGAGYHVTARVEFDDGTTAEVRRKVHHGMGDYDVGAILPFRYDVDDRSKIELDEPAMQAMVDALRAKVDAYEQERAAQPIPKGGESAVSSVTATATALEQMSQLAGRHKSGELSDADYEAQLEEIRAEARKHL
jgi:hypothetical protein